MSGDVYGFWLSYYRIPFLPLRDWGMTHYANAFAEGRFEIQESPVPAQDVSPAKPAAEDLTEQATEKDAAIPDGKMTVVRAFAAVQKLRETFSPNAIPNRRSELMQQIARITPANTPPPSEAELAQAIRNTLPQFQGETEDNTLGNFISWAAHTTKQEADRFYQSQMPVQKKPKEDKSQDALSPEADTLYTAEKRVEAQWAGVAQYFSDLSVDDVKKELYGHGYDAGYFEAIVGFFDEYAAYFEPLENPKELLDYAKKLNRRAVAASDMRNGHDYKFLKKGLNALYADEEAEHFQKSIEHFMVYDALRHGPFKWNVAEAEAARAMEMAGEESKKAQDAIERAHLDAALTHFFNALHAAEVAYDPNTATHYTSAETNTEENPVRVLVGYKRLAELPNKDEEKIKPAQSLPEQVIPALKAQVIRCSPTTASTERQKMATLLASGYGAFVQRELEEIEDLFNKSSTRLEQAKKIEAALKAIDPESKVLSDGNCANPTAVHEFVFNHRSQFLDLLEFWPLISGDEWLAERYGARYIGLLSITYKGVPILQSTIKTAFRMGDETKAKRQVNFARKNPGDLRTRRILQYGKLIGDGDVLEVIEDVEQGQAHSDIAGQLLTGHFYEAGENVIATIRYALAVVLQALGIGHVRRFADDPILQEHANRLANQVRIAGGYDHVIVREGAGFFIDASFNDSRTDPSIPPGTGILLINSYLRPLSIPHRGNHEAYHVILRQSGEVAALNLARTWPRLARVPLVRRFVNWIREEKLVNARADAQLTQHAHDVAAMASNAADLATELARTEDANVGQTMTHWLASLLRRGDVSQQDLATVNYARRSFLGSA
jgi:hypothetical protein